MSNDQAPCPIVNEFLIIGIWSWVFYLPCSPCLRG
jgi:hypothetical protein